MPAVNAHRRTDNQISWKTLAAYARAVHQFTVSTAPRLTGDSFQRLAAAEVISPPEAQVFLTSDGCRLGYRAYPARSGLRVLVLVHGSGGFGDQMHLMARELAAHDLASVYTLDMRGHGLSEGRRGHAVAYPDQLIDDVAEFLADLRLRRPEAMITLGGHSAGGGLVLALSRTEADKLVSSYLFLAPFLGLGSGVSRPHFGGWVKVRGWAMRAVALANALGVTAFNGATVVDFDAAAAADPRYVANWSFNTTLAFGPGRWRPDAPPAASGKPVLVLAGERDECFVSWMYGQAFSVAAPQAQVRLLGPIGHWDLLVDPAAIAAVAGWLADQSLEDLRQLGAEASRQATAPQRRRAS